MMVIMQTKLWRCGLIAGVITGVVLMVLQYNSIDIKNWTLHGNGSSLESNKYHMAITEEENEDSKTLKPSIEKKTILYWTKMFNSRNFYFGEGDIFKGCPTSNCMGTDDREYQAVDKFDVVMFHGPELNDTDLPHTRSPHQYYIFMDLETQIFHPIPNKPAFRNFFNWTMAYRRDADIMRPYGIFRNISSGEVIPPYIPTQWMNVSNGVVDEEMRKLFTTKTKMVAWFVSHCRTHSKRENVAKKLQKYVTVDIYGQCGDFKCPRSEGAACYKNLETNYFFYFSFENSMCRDYLTEKVYKILEYNIIPVVYGAADYKSFLPPKSYISVLDFSSVEALAKYLIELSKNPKEYMEYFKWKKFYKVENAPKYIICKFCEVLHQQNSRKVIEDIYKWWIGESHCTT